MKYFIIIALTFFILSFERSECSAQAGTTSLRALTYNIKGLPHIFAPSWHNERYSIIAKKLADRIADGTAPDVVLLQEAFSRDVLPLIQNSGYPYFSQGPQKNGEDSQGNFKKVLNGGLYILSRHPIIAAGVINFERNICTTWDCKANKGSQYVKIKIPGVTKIITIFNTHMQAGVEYDFVRTKQLDTLFHFVKNHFNQNNEIFLFGGDFNSSPDLISFSVFKNTLNVLSTGEVCLSIINQCQILDNTSPNSLFAKSIDHLFIMKSQMTDLLPYYTVRNFTDIFKGKTLSDHLGFEAGYILKP